MTLRHAIYVGLTLALAVPASAADPGIRLPTDGDDYSALVAKTAAHDASVDFRALRLAFLKSKANARADSDAIDSLRGAMVNATRVSPPDAALVRQKAEQILSIDYTDMQAHKLLRQSCTILHDDACAELHHFIEFGLLTSITNSGDGKTCAKGWEVVTIKEEYFVLSMMDVTFEQQALVSDGGHSCDAMTVRDQSGAEQVYYFNADIVLATEAAALGLK